MKGLAASGKVVGAVSFTFFFANTVVFLTPYFQKYEQTNAKKQPRIFRATVYVSLFGFPLSWLPCQQIARLGSMFTLFLS